MKSREIWIWDYFANLQLEYLTYYARFLTYSREEDKKKFSDICNKKCRKILKLAMRLGANSIFTDCETWNKYVLKWMGNGNGLPKFCYSNENQIDMYDQFDRYFYFPDGSWITWQNKEYQIIKHLVFTKELLIKGEKVTRRVTYNEVIGQGFQLLSITEEELDKLKAGDDGETSA